VSRKAKSLKEYEEDYPYRVLKTWNMTTQDYGKVCEFLNSLPREDWVRLWRDGLQRYAFKNEGDAVAFRLTCGQ